MLGAIVSLLLIAAAAFAVTKVGGLITLALIAAVLILAYRRLSLLAFTVTFTVLFAAYVYFAPSGTGALVWKGCLALLLAALWLLNVRRLRKALITRPFMKTYLKLLPTMSATEREALEAGTVWWDGELFTGAPRWEKLLAARPPKLSTEEQAFLDGPCEDLCRLLDDWNITHERGDLPPHVWEFMKSRGFFAMIIPKKYGGLEFSAYAHSCVLVKLASRSPVASSTVAVPNSLGPGELLNHYGTEEQKEHYLPRLARGEEVPCFALTGPRAGSDAGSIPDTGIVCRGTWQGRETLGLRLNFDKRYITLAPVATVIGLAFRMFDPERLLSEKTDLGITVALIPRNTPGVTVGRRHFPINVPFQNGPVHGKDVFVPLDAIVGGPKMAGSGWRMLVEQLSVGRCISLPSSATGGAKAGVWATGAYARIRSQFNTPVARFEGVETVIARMAGLTYTMDAARSVTAGAIDGGEKPSVPSAMLKYHVTEMGRQVANDAMDVHGGKGIQLGPRNYLGRGYQVVPVAITVEGANILTRSLIIFGQGAIRCHPFVLKEIAAAGANDLAAFDSALWGHISFTIANAARSLYLGITGGQTVSVPGAAPETRRYLQMMTRFSAAFALLSDVSMFVIGGSLKRREKISGRLGDILSMLYIASATVKRFHDEGRQQEDLPLLTWAMYDCFFQLQVAMDGVLDNFPNRFVAAWLRMLVFPKGLTLNAPFDKTGSKVATILLTPGAARDRLTAGIYLPRKEDDVIGRLEFAMEAVIKADPIEARVRAAMKEGKLKQPTLAERRAAAVQQGIITQEEHDHLFYTDRLRREVVKVDDHEPDLSRGAKQAEDSWQADSRKKAAVASM